MTYFFVFVVTLVVGAMVTLLYSERLRKTSRRPEKTLNRPARPKSGKRPKKRRR